MITNLQSLGGSNTHSGLHIYKYLARIDGEYTGHPVHSATVLKLIEIKNQINLHK